MVSATDPVTPLENLFNGITNDRQLLTYRWANAAARTAQTGMFSGAMGYQVDNGAYYEYTGTSWEPRYIIPPAAGVVRSNTAVNIPATTWTPLTNTANWTYTGGTPSRGGINTFNGTWVAPFTGRYTVSSQITVNATVNMFLAIKKNDTNANANGSILLNTAAGTSLLTAAGVSGEVTLAAGDVLRVYVFLSGAAAWNTSTELSFFNIRYTGTN